MARKPIKKTKIFYRKGVVKFPVFDYTVHFVETDNFDLAIQQLKLKSHAVGELTEAATWNGSEGCESYIFVHKTHQPISTIVHECWHAVFRMLSFRGLNMMDEENVAYHLDYLVKQAMSFYGKENQR